MSVTIRAQALAGAEPIVSSDEMYRMGLEASVSGDQGRLDLILAHKWFNLAAMQGHVEARAYRAELAREMTPDEVAEAQRMAREYLAAHRPRVAN